MSDCYCKRVSLDPSVRRMRSNDGIVHGVNGCFSSGETGVGGRSWEKRALDAEEAVERVWELIDRADNNGEWPGMLVRVSAVRKALEGDSDD